MKKSEIELIKEKLESIRLNCEEQIAANGMDEFAQSNWQHATDALALLRFQKGNPASKANGKKGGRPKSE